MRKKNNILSKKKVDSFKKDWQHRFESFAKKHDDDASIAGWSVTGLETRFRYFKSWFSTNKSFNSKWLDLGCGAGSYSRYLQECGYSVFGIDYSMPSILKAREKSDDDILWAVADATQLPIRKMSVDGIICFGVTQVLPDSRGIVNEACHTLKNGGEIWIDGLNRMFLPYLLYNILCFFFHKSNKLRYESPYMIKKLLIQNGINEVEVFWMPMVPSELPRLQWLIERASFHKIISAFSVVGALISHGFMVVGRKSI